MFDVFFLKDSKYNYPTVYFYFGNMKEMAEDFYQMIIGDVKVALAIDCETGEMFEHPTQESSKIFEGSRYDANLLAKNNKLFAQWLSGKEGLFYHRTFQPEHLENTNIPYVLSEDEIISILNGNIPEEEFEIKEWQNFVEWYSSNLMFCNSITIDTGE